jgi:hypothetical protein
MSEPEITRFCQQCNAPVAAAAKVTTCPACGGSLIAHPGPNFDPPGAPPAQVDHRGIVLPRRHAVGGVITPR